MSTVIPQHFRPTAVVCVGTAGREIGEQLVVLLPSLDPARRAGVAVLAVEDGALDSGGRPIGHWFDPDLAAVIEHSAFAGAPSLSAPPTPLPLLMVEALRGQDVRAVPASAPSRRGVLDASTITRIQDDSSTVSRMSAVVWIVAAAESPLLLPVAESVRVAMESEHIEALVLLALANIPPHEPEAHRAHDDLCGKQPWGPLLLDNHGEKPLAAFAYLFEALGEQQTYWAGRYDVPFAAAEAIFVMTATGITVTHEFEMSLRRSLPRMVKYPYERISGVGACRLTFPRAQAEQYCGNHLGAQLMRGWDPGETREEPSPASLKDAEQRAVAFISGLSEDIRDTPARSRAGRPSPPLSAQALAQSRGMSQGKPDGGLIFRHFNYSEFERFINSYQDLPDVLSAQNQKAEHGFAQWQDTVRARWEGYEHERERELSREANELMLRGAAGVAEARTYMRELNQLLAVEQDRLATRRENRELAYEHFLREMEERSHGPWLGTATAGGQKRNSSGAEAVTGKADESPGSGVGQTWTSELLNALTERYRWEMRRRPSLAAIAGAICSVVPVGVLLGQSVLPRQWFANNRLAIPLLAILLIVVSGLFAWAYIAYRRSRERRAAEDLRQLYRRVHSYQCELYEDLRRAALFSGLHHLVRRLLDRLLEWNTFLASVADLMESDAESISQELFDGAMGRRDVLFANRHVLRPHDYNLSRFVQDVTAKRKNESIVASHTANGAAEWHHSLATMLPFLRAALQDTNLLDTSPDALRHPVREFALTVIRPYLSGDMVSIGAALEAMPAFESAGIFDRLVQQAAILYQPATPPQRSNLFVAARGELRQNIMKEDQAAGSVLLRIDDDEWLGLLRLQPGGAIPAFWRADWDAHHSNVPASPSWYQPERDALAN
ncbi:MAG: hypothetical protein ACLQUY_13495 [Ktedonobacterales bacterium]